jgi:hypothetical protein
VCVCVLVCVYACVCREELAALQSQARSSTVPGGGGGGGGEGDKGLKSQLQTLDEEVETLTVEKGRLNQQLVEASVVGDVAQIRYVCLYVYVCVCVCVYVCM